MEVINFFWWAVVPSVIVIIGWIVVAAFVARKPLPDLENLLSEMKRWK
jgi:hypothetical protein